MGKQLGFQSGFSSHRRGYGFVIMTNADSGSGLIEEMSRRIQTLILGIQQLKPSPGTVADCALTKDQIANFAAPFSWVFFFQR